MLQKTKSIYTALLSAVTICISTITYHAQSSIDTNQINGFTTKKPFTVGNVTISGGQYLDTVVIKTISELKSGDIVYLPADEKIAKAFKTIWSQGILDDLSIDVVRMYNDSIDLDIKIKERPRLSYFSLKGVTKTHEAEIKENLKASFKTMNILSEAIKIEIRERIKLYFQQKGFANVQVALSEIPDPSQPNTVGLIIDVTTGKKIKNNAINFVGNNNASDLKLKGKLKDTKEKVRISLYPAYSRSIYGNEPLSWDEYISQKGYLVPTKTLEYLDPYFKYKFFSTSKFDRKKYEDDKLNVINYYNSIGYRDAIITEDTVYSNPDQNRNIDIRINEGKKYYFGNISWSGNTKYSDSTLTAVLGIKKGDVYNSELLRSKLGNAPSMDGSIDLGALYSDRGYLFFRADYEESAIVNDTIHVTIKLIEGLETRIKRIIITGNDRTNDHVIRRELQTKPGNVFSRADVFSSIRQLSSLGYIDANNINPEPKVNPSDNTVDIVYNVAEKPNDQFEAQVGYGGGIGFTGSLGITLNNFSLRNVLKKSEWKPIPMGDGQSIGARWQSNGLYFNSFNFNFSEPWLGGKKPIGLTFGLVYTRFSSGGYSTGLDPNSSYIRNYGGNIILSKRLKWPDYRFVGAIGVNYQNYLLKEYYGLFTGNEGFANGTSNNLNLIINLQRSSVDNPIFPRSGSNISLNIKVTPPFSLLGQEKDYSTMTNQEKYKWIEYHKYRFDVDWYQTLVGNLVFRVNSKLGYLGYYNKNIGHSPFERYYVGGDGMQGFNYFIGRDVIAHRGYESYNENAVLFNKHTFELRYPFSLNPNSTIFGLLFYEMANGWNSYQDYNPFRLNRSAGVGLRMTLPMFGLLGFDYGFGFDAHTPGAKFGASAKFSFMLSREPD